VLDVVNDLKVQGYTNIKAEEWPKGITNKKLYELYGGWPRYTFESDNLFGLSPLAANVTLRKGKPWQYYVCWQVPDNKTMLYYTALKNEFMKDYPNIPMQEQNDRYGCVTWWNLKVPMKQVEPEKFVTNGPPDSMRLSMLFGNEYLYQRVYLQCFVGSEKGKVLNLSGVSKFFIVPDALLTPTATK
jgi:hypothetical protein